MPAADLCRKPEISQRRIRTAPGARHQRPAGVHSLRRSQHGSLSLRQAGRWRLAGPATEPSRRAATVRLEALNEASQQPR
jgi:hypothetical protein